jgi:hypothetical protein
MYNHPAMFAGSKRRRWWAIVMLAAIAFAQVSLAFSDCQLDRTALLATMRSSTNEPCDHGGLVAKNWIKFENRCFAHCTADLQMVGDAVVLVRGPADAPVLALAPLRPLSLARIAFDAPQPGAPPPRILFRSFLI